MLHFSVKHIAKAAQSWQMQQADPELTGEGLPHLSGHYKALSLKKLSHFHQQSLAVKLAAII